MLKKKKTKWLFLPVILAVVIAFNLFSICVSIGANLEINRGVRSAATRLLYKYLSVVSEEKAERLIMDGISEGDDFDYFYLVRVGSNYGLNGFDTFVINEIKNSSLEATSIDKLTALIRALGYLGKNENLNFLKKYKAEISTENDNYILAGFIDESLYFSRCDDCDYGFIVDDSMQEKLEVIVSSIDRTRHYSEMLMLDRIYVNE